MFAIEACSASVSGTKVSWARDKNGRIMLFDEKTETQVIADSLKTPGCH